MTITIKDGVIKAKKGHLMKFLKTTRERFPAAWLTDFRGSARKELNRFSLDKVLSDFV